MAAEGLDGHFLQPTLTQPVFELQPLNYLNDSRFTIEFALFNVLGFRAASFGIFASQSMWDGHHRSGPNRAVHSSALGIGARCLLYLPRVVVLRITGHRVVPLLMNDRLRCV